MMVTQNQGMVVMITVELRKDFFVQGVHRLGQMYAMKSVETEDTLDLTNAMMEILTL